MSLISKFLEKLKTRSREIVKAKVFHQPNSKDFIFERDEETDEKHSNYPTLIYLSPFADPC